MDKAKYMPRMYTDDDLDTMQMLRCAFDPQRLAEPRQGLPDTAAVRGAPGRHKGPTRCQQAGLAEVF
jgi:glycolate oxidase